MGSCASAAGVFSPKSSNLSELTTSKVCIPPPDNAIFSQRVSDQNRRREPFVKTREKSLSEEYVQNYLTSNVTHMKPPSRDRKASTSTLTSLNHTLHSDSCISTANLISYDGLNNRPVKRNDIGMHILKAQIHFGADPNEMCTHGDRTCLMFAVLANDFSFTKKLVEEGVDINKTNCFGETALGLAIEMQNDEIVNYLSSKGAADVVLSLN